MGKDSKKLLLVGPSTGSVHLRNYFHLVRDYFDDVLIITTDQIDYCNFKIIDFSFRKPLRIAGNIRKFRRIIEEYEPTIIHVHQANTGAYIATKANRGKYPLVVTCWGSDVLVLPQRGIVYKHVAKYVLNAADFIIVDAIFMADAIKNLGVTKDITIANFGIDYVDIEIPEKEKIVYSNRLHRALYNVDTIILAFKEFLEKKPDWKLIIGADGPLTLDLKLLAEQNLPRNTYEFIGFVNAEENLKYYIKSWLWVSIPSSDGTAISLLEAMGYGCIPVVSDIPSNKEWIEDNVNGCIVTENLSDTMVQASKLPIKEVQILNGKIIIEKATKTSNKAIFEAIYDSFTH